MFSLQKRVFDEASERLVAVLQVKKPKKKEKKDKKGKKTYLCLTRKQIQHLRASHN
jgi:hypothetical protein